jgi:TusA-related sulfurtransferase
MIEKTVEDLTEGEITEIRFKSSASKRRIDSLRKDRALYEAVLRWTLNPSVKQTMQRKISEIDKELQ